MSDFDTVYRDHAGRIHGYLARLTGDRWTADELCQETFVRYLRNEEQLRSRNGALASWLFRVATNLARDRHRRKKAGPLEYDPVDGAAGAAEISEARDLDSRVAAEIARLPEELRAVFLLRAHHDLTYDRIADAVDACTRTVKDRFRRAREILAHRLRSDWEGPG